MKDERAPTLALSAMAMALSELRPKLGEEDYGRLRAIMTGGNTVLHRGETVMTLVRKLDEKIREALPDPVALLFVGDFSEADWRRAFEAVDEVGKIESKELSKGSRARSRMFPRRSTPRRILDVDRLVAVARDVYAVFPDVRLHEALKPFLVEES
jgi:hypothetical protein